MDSRYNPHPPDMRHASPDALRPNSDLVARARQNFKRRPNHPSPSQLPMPSLKLLTSEQSPSQVRRQPSSKTAIGANRNWTVRRRPKSAPHASRTQIVKGKKRTWTVKPKFPSPKTQIIKGKNRIWTVKNAGKRKRKRKTKGKK